MARSTKIQHRYKRSIPIGNSSRERVEPISWLFTVTVRSSLIAFVIPSVVNCITVERGSWMQNFRGNVAKFSTKLERRCIALPALQQLQNSARCIDGWRSYETVCNWHFRLILKPSYYSLFLLFEQRFDGYWTYRIFMIEIFFFSFLILSHSIIRS